MPFYNLSYWQHIDAETHGCHFADSIFKCICVYLNEKMEFRFKFHWNQQATSNGSDNGVASNRQQYMNWINYCLFTDAYMRQSAPKS